MLNLEKQKLNFKGHSQTIPQPNSGQNLFTMFQPWCWSVMQKMKSKDQAIFGTFYVKNQAIWLTQRILGPKLKNLTENCLK